LVSFSKKWMTTVLLPVIGLFLSGCPEKDEVLSAARSISGTWTTPAAVTFFMTSDGCGNYSRYNSTPITMTWTITTVDDVTVNVLMAANSIGTTSQVGSNCGAPSILNFPLEFRGVISSSKLILLENQMQYSNSGAALGLQYVEVGNFNFTTSNLTGTIAEKDCPIYCMGYETDASKCILQRK
jgi:hypothetical protein